ncbi:MarR family transcriptional regulator [Paenibacillus sp. LjRoot153]|uniref:MarR family winged helix-turn-helix transcriptional regulator n=1 Tax=Paenibacillus sp. LjRoot153 TaxID=3342270 RepID=UPI003ED08825
MDRLSEFEIGVWREFLKTHAKVIERIEQDLANYKRVPLSTYDVLIALYEATNKKLRVNDINKKILLTKSGLTRLLDRLEKEGLIRREKSEIDRRGSYAILTSEGETQLRKAWPIYANGIKNYFVSSLTEQQLKMLEDSLKIIQQKI